GYAFTGASQSLNRLGRAGWGIGMGRETGRRVIGCCREGMSGMAKTETGGGRAQVIKGVLEKIEKEMGGDKMKATMGDYIRLVQLHKELDEESPKEIKVTWVEPKSGSEE
ncbi:MAG: hypothetical protein M3N41_10930, partial [Acidobacteriota bacterium]|nr:hypothetical protein [Acidobacteriota bacterium]